MRHFLMQLLPSFLQSRLQQATNVTDNNDGLMALPSILQNQILRKLDALRSPIAYQKSVQTEVEKAIANWQQNPDAPNSLVFLGSPVEAIADILNDSLRPWVDPPVTIITPLPCLARPQNPLLLTHQIREALQIYTQLEPENQQQADQQLSPNALENRQTLVLIPCLEQCFLRCIGGWGSVEYLRDVAINHRNCFWVIGCNHWAWNFLDFVCQVSAYFSEVKSLPSLDGEMLEAWLEPVVQMVVKDQDAEESPEAGDRQGYWETLARRSLGVSSIAKNLWLQGLRIKAEQVPDPEDLQNLLLPSTDEPGEIIFHETKPTVPSLPSLSSGDRYLLHSLLIHGQMTRAHLAFSLGQREGQIQSQIQALLRAGLLVRSDGGLIVEATHYAKLKTELANNNFFVGDD